jgi:predicted AAA+ superfamily ATPase
MKFKRKQTIEENFYPGRVLVIYGPRRVGKTTMLEKYLSTQQDKRVLSVTGDDILVREIFASQSQAKLRSFASSYDVIAIDEAQQVPAIGIGAKMLVDSFPEKQFLLTGSSSFDLSSQIGEPLTGRHFTLTLLPVAQSELSVGAFEISSAVEEFLVYGSYPEVLLASDISTKERILRELVSSYLYKDVLALEKIKSPGLLRDIARMIAFQIGDEVSLNEIAVALHTNVHTIARYLDLLEKMFVIRRVGGFSRNLRNEITKKAKYYFLDNGVRNAVIEQFSPLSLRNDVGALWENFIAMELMKQSNVAGRADQYYFWRTHTGAEVDIVRESGSTLSAIECKWSKDAKVPPLWKRSYPESDFTVINRENYLDRLL